MEQFTQSVSLTNTNLIYFLKKCVRVKKRGRPHGFIYISLTFWVSKDIRFSLTVFIYIFSKSTVICVVKANILNFFYF